MKTRITSKVKFGWYRVLFGLGCLSYITGGEDVWTIFFGKLLSSGDLMEIPER
jgi:hypothetical protein